MASSISSVGDLVAVIRAQLGVRHAPNRRADPARRAAPAQRKANEGLAELIGARVMLIDPADPERGRKAFRVFLEAVLLSHFGSKMVNDPRFYQMVDDVQGAMQADPASARLIAAAIGHLLEAKP